MAFVIEYSHKLRVLALEPAGAWTFSRGFPVRGQGLHAAHGRSLCSGMIEASMELVKNWGAKESQLPNTAGQSHHAIHASGCMHLMEGWDGLADTD